MSKINIIQIHLIQIKHQLSWLLNSKIKTPFTGDSAAESIVKALDKYCPEDEFEIVKLPHHGSEYNISRELIRRLNTKQFIVSTNKALEKVVLLRFSEERQTTELLCNYQWWKSEYFTEDDKKSILRLINL